MIEVLRWTLGYIDRFLGISVSRFLPFSIIGADFFKYYDLDVSVSRRRLIDRTTKRFTISSVVSTPAVTVSTVDRSNDYMKILAKFPEITGVAQQLPLKSSEVEHHILTYGQPVAERLRRLAPDKLKAAKAEFKRLMELRICRLSSSPWASPLHLIRKKTDEWSACGDYRRLNAIAIPDKYPAPHLHDFTTNLLGKKIFPPWTFSRHIIKYRW